MSGELFPSIAVAESCTGGMLTARFVDTPGSGQWFKGGIILQLVTFVFFATYVIHRGSPQSRDSADEMASDIKAIREKMGA